LILTCFSGAEKIVAETKKRIGALLDAEFTTQNLRKLLKVVSKDLNVGMKDIFMTMRAVLTGNEVGAGIPETIHVLGKSTVLRRFSRFLQSL
jgi:glutamyl/glutaminyl-tRNA synthetase